MDLGYQISNFPGFSEFSVVAQLEQPLETKMQDYWCIFHVLFFFFFDSISVRLGYRTLCSTLHQQIASLFHNHVPWSSNKNVVENCLGTSAELLCPKSSGWVLSVWVEQNVFTVGRDFGVTSGESRGWAVWVVVWLRMDAASLRPTAVSFIESFPSSLPPKSSVPSPSYPSYLLLMHLPPTSCSWWDLISRHVRNFEVCCVSWSCCYFLIAVEWSLVFACWRVLLAAGRNARWTFLSPVCSSSAGRRVSGLRVGLLRKELSC